MHQTTELTELKKEIDTSSIIVGDFDTPLTVIDRNTRQKISKDTEELNNTVNQIPTEFWQMQKKQLQDLYEKAKKPEQLFLKIMKMKNKVGGINLKINKYMEIQYAIGQN